MSKPDFKHLFTPGDGGIPPYLAGRKREQEYFRDCVEALKNRKPISRNMLVYGPRGNGKTALLSYLQKETSRKEGKTLEIVWATPGKMKTPEQLINLLWGKKKFKDRLQKASGSVGGALGAAGIEIDLSSSLSAAEDLLSEKCKHKPLILIIDEAHRLKPEIAEDLLNASQTVRREGNPFLLVLAGTPNLKSTLAKANASFWDRSELFPLGRLSPEEARDAIIVPLQETGVSFASGVVEEIVERTHCYPFFLQVHGDCLARRMQQSGARTVSMDMLQEVEAETVSKRDAMYQIRFDEIKKAGLLTVAASIADAFIQGTQPYLHERTVEEAIRKGMADDGDPVTDRDIMGKLEQLSHLGYVWRIGGYDYEPGIPSLMSFVQEYSRS